MTATPAPAATRGPMTLRDWAQLLLLGGLWGGSFFFARIAVAELHPLALVLLRVSIAAAALQAWLALRGPSFRLALPHAPMFFLLALAGHNLYQIAGDGNAFKETVPLQNLLLAPAERAEVLIQASTTPGTYEFRSLLWGPDYQEQPDALLATVVIEGDPITPQAIPDALVPYEDLRGLPVDHSRTTEFQEPGPPLYLAIDGKHWDPDRIDQTVKLGALEEWTIKNTSSHWHPFHIHINDFQVISINGEPVDAPGWYDTVSVPAQGEIQILHRFLDFTGKYVFHCHILMHEDAGMMAVVEVVE